MLKVKNILVIETIKCKYIYNWLIGGEETDLRYYDVFRVERKPFS